MKFVIKTNLEYLSRNEKKMTVGEAISYYNKYKTINSELVLDTDSEKINSDFYDESMLFKRIDLLGLNKNNNIIFNIQGFIFDNDIDEEFNMQLVAENSLKSTFYNWYNETLQKNDSDCKFNHLKPQHNILVIDYITFNPRYKQALLYSMNRLPVITYEKYNFRPDVVILDFTLYYDKIYNEIIKELNLNKVDNTHYFDFCYPLGYYYDEMDEGF